jgi:hypothetical protein
MVKAFSYLKSVFHILQHITCLAHALNRVCERIRENFINVNNLISNMKKVLIKSPHRRQIYTQQTKLKLPIFPCITRWNTWLNASFYYFEHFNIVKKFVLNLKDNSYAIKLSKQLFSKKTIYEHLSEVYNYKFWPESIVKL